MHCFLPNTKSGLVEPSGVEADNQQQYHEDSIEASPTTNFSFDIPYVRKQFKSSYLLESMRLHRIGMFLSFLDIFYRLYSLVALLRRIYLQCHSTALWYKDKNLLILSSISELRNDWMNPYKGKKYKLYRDEFWKNQIYNWPCWSWLHMILNIGDSPELYKLCMHYMNETCFLRLFAPLTDRISSFGT